MINLTTELRDWHREVSPLTAYAQTLRNEGESGASQNPDASKQADDAQKIVDHFEGVDLDELPENARKAINSAKEYLNTTQKTLATTEERRVKAESFARTKQAEADKFRGIIQKHNLPADGTTPNLSSDKHTARVDRFVKQHGLKPEAAEIYAKLFESEAEEIKKGIIGELGPLAGAVGGIQANQLLSQAMSAHSELFAIKEIAESVSNNVNAMVNEGNAVNAGTIEHLLEMAVGSYHMKNPGKGIEKKDDTVPNFSGMGVSTGGFHNSTAPADSKTPRVTQPETASIVNAITAHMKQGLPTKKASK